ncbi:MAG TPA: ribosome silencing factor [Thermodesulfobacteriota bacterium]|nr:ribosome silencing factor [Thermodesulfobacteriota bacterium]
MLYPGKKTLCKGGTSIKPREKAIALAQAAWEKNAQDTVLLDMKTLTDVTDYFIICSADSDRGVKTIVDNIEKKLKELGLKIMGIEGYTEGRWVLIDTSDVIIHVFYDPVRRFYDLEGLWIDAPRIKLAFEDGFSRQHKKRQEDYA